MHTNVATLICFITRVDNPYLFLFWFRVGIILPGKGRVIHVYTCSYMCIAEHMMLKDGGIYNVLGGGKSSVLPPLYTHNMYMCVPTV